MITYSDSKIFDTNDIKRLFGSVGWKSAEYPEKIVRGLRNSSAVISAWDGKRLVGLVRGLDDGETVAFLHYLLVDPEYRKKGIGKELMTRILAGYSNMLYVKIMPSDPKTVEFYEKFGFRSFDNYSAMQISRL